MVADLIGEFQPVTVVADAEPLVAPWDSFAPDVVRRAIRFTERLAAAAPDTLRLLVIGIPVAKVVFGDRVRASRNAR